MVKKIKGPIKVNMKGKNIADFITEQVGDITLPFEAIGWTSEKNQDLVPGSGSVEVKNKKPKRVKKTKKK